MQASRRHGPAADYQAGLSMNCEGQAWPATPAAAAQCACCMCSPQRTWVVHAQLHIRLHCFAHMIASHVPALGEAQHLCNQEFRASSAFEVDETMGIMQQQALPQHADDSRAPPWRVHAGATCIQHLEHPTGQVQPVHPGLTCLSVSRSALLRSAVSTNSRNWPTAKQEGGSAGR